MSDGGYNGLKAFAFTVGVTVLIFLVLYVAKRYHPGLFGRETLPRNLSWYSPNDPLGIGLDGRRSLGERPKMWDVWIASWNPLCSQRGSRSEGLGRGEGEKRDAGRTADSIDECRRGCGKFTPLSADKVSNAVPSPQLRDGLPVQRTSSTQIRISTIILMPARPPRFTSPPSTSSATPSSNDTDVDPPREYALGMSYAPYTLDD